MIDLESVKQRADLLDIIGRDTLLKHVASTNGGEYAGACPFCGGSDRLRVQPNARPGRWCCRVCTGVSGLTVIDYIARRDNLDPKKGSELQEICKRALGGELPTAQAPHHPTQPKPQPAYTQPGDTWQDNAKAAVAKCKETLYSPSGAAALEYLYRRGLNDETIRYHRLGFSPGCKFGDLYIPRGIVIPCCVYGAVWYLKISVIDGIGLHCIKCKRELNAPGRCPACDTDNRYRGVKGNRTAAIYNADMLRGSDTALFVEGEFDCMIAEQTIGDLLPCATLGSATNAPDLAAWGHYLTSLKKIYAIYDMDQAGGTGGAKLAELAPSRIQRLELPKGKGKDINDFISNGGNFRKWIEIVLLSGGEVVSME